MDAPSPYFTVFQEGPVTVVKFTEKHLNDRNIQQIGDGLAGIAEHLKQGELHLDFSEVNYLSSVVLGKLLSLHRSVTREGGRFVLTNLDALYEVFSVVRLDTLLDLRRANADSAPPRGGTP